MADISGLVIGSVALASLFSACIDLFDHFELGKNYVYDYKLACTKVVLLRTRLEHWGNTLKIVAPGFESPALIEHWPDERDTIGRSLWEIKRILNDTGLLVQKYNLIPNQALALGRDFKSPPSKPNTSFRKRTLWAIHDKAKFDKLIEDLAFLIENLEAVIGRLHISSDQSDHRGGSRDLGLRPYGDHQTFSPMQEIARTAPRENDPFVEDGTWSGQRSQEAEEHQPLPRTRHVVSGVQNNFHFSIGLQGVLGKTKDEYSVEGTQTNHHCAIGIQGGASPEAIAFLQDRAYARQRR